MPKNKVFSSSQAITAEDLNTIAQDGQIVQTVGNSEKDIMSQKVVMDELAKKMISYLT